MGARLFNPCGRLTGFAGRMVRTTHPGMKGQYNGKED